jgi:hypothetical protein
VVAARVLAFLRIFAAKTLPSMTSGAFREQCEALAMAKLEKPRSLADDAANFWEPLADRRVYGSPNGSPNGSGSRGGDAALRGARQEAAALGKVSQRHVEAAVHAWLLGPVAACLQVHVVGRAFAATSDPEGASDLAAGVAQDTPLPGQARVTVTSAPGPPRVWEGPVEACAVALGDEDTFPCFVSRD